MGQDIDIIRRVKRELNRRSCDTSRVQVRVSYGVVYLTGELHKSRGMGMATLQEEREILRNVLLHIPGVREISDNLLRLVE